MKLLCIAPDGSLEEWQEHDAKTHHAWPAWTIVCGNWEGHDVIWSIYGAVEYPEFWGRIVLEEV